MKTQFARFIYIFFLLCNQGAFAHYGNSHVLQDGMASMPDTSKEIKLVSLNGEWYFVPGNFLPASSSWAELVQEEKIKVDVPGIWNNQINNSTREKGQGYGTFFILVHLNSWQNKELAVHTLSTGTASNWYANGNLIARSGKAGKTKSSTTPSYHSVTGTFKVSTDSLLLVVHVSNFHHRKGGIWKPVTLGQAKNVKKKHALALGFEFIFFGAILFIGLNHLLIFFQQKRYKSGLFFSILCILVAVRVVFTGERIAYFLNPNISWDILIRMEYLSFYLAAPVFFLYTYFLFPRDLKKWPGYTFVAFGILLGGAFFFIPVQVFTRTLVPYQLLCLGLAVYALVMLLKAIKKGRVGAGFFLVSLCIFLATFLNDILYHHEIISTTNLTQTGFLLFIFFQSYFLSSRANRQANLSIKLARDLETINQNLENVVEARTLETSLQKETLEEKNKEMRDSINYAKRIQKAILAPPLKVKKYFDDFMILHQPRDIVSGDFYWIRETRDHLLWAVGDCTGHGVPGAFMSLLSYNFLDETLNRFFMHKGDNELLNPAKVLNMLRKKIIKAFGQHVDNPESTSGLDVGLCMLNKENRTLEYAGANISAYIITGPDVIPDLDHRNFVIENHEEGNRVLVQIKGDKMPVGYYLVHDNFKNYQFQLKKEDVVYMFTDGYADQFGGPDNKKFMLPRLRKLLLKIYPKSMREQKATLYQTIKKWRGKGQEQIDDILAFGIKV